MLCYRWGLRVTPIAGFLSAALILFFLLDPPRGESEGSKLKSTSLAADLKYLMKKYSQNMIHYCMVNLLINILTIVGVTYT